MENPTSARCWVTNFACAKCCCRHTSCNGSKVFFNVASLLDRIRLHPENWHGTLESPIYKDRSSSKPPVFCSILIFRGKIVLFTWGSYDMPPSWTNPKNQQGIPLWLYINHPCRVEITQHTLQSLHSHLQRSFITSEWHTCHQPEVYKRHRHLKYNAGDHEI